MDLTITTELIPQLISREDASKRLSVGLRTLDRYLTGGEIPFLKIGRSVRIETAAINRFLEKKRQVSAPVSNPKIKS